MAFLLLAGGATAAQAGAQDGEMTAQACESNNFHTWCYGSSIDGFSKRCWSNYKNSWYRHSATAVIGSNTDTDYAAAGQWAKAAANGGWTQTCYTRYNPEA